MYLILALASTVVALCISLLLLDVVGRHPLCPNVGMWHYVGNVSSTCIGLHLWLGSSASHLCKPSVACLVLPVDLVWPVHSSRAFVSVSQRPATPVALCAAAAVPGVHTHLFLCTGQCVIAYGMHLSVCAPALSTTVQAWAVQEGVGVFEQCMPQFSCRQGSSVCLCWHTGSSAGMLCFRDVLGRRGFGSCVFPRFCGF